MPDRGPSVGRAIPRALLVTVLGLGVLLGLSALVILGSRLAMPGSGSASVGSAQPAQPAQTVAPTLTSPPATTPTLVPGPVAAGVQAWTDLRGGECLEPFTSAWQARYVVVDCGLPHAGQLIARAPIAGTASAPYPGEAAITAPLGLLCTGPAVLDSTAAAAYADLLSQASYPVSADQWAAGQRDYLCFISRGSGEPLLGSIATLAVTVAG